MSVGLPLSPPVLCPVANTNPKNRLRERIKLAPREMTNRGAKAPLNAWRKVFGKKIPKNVTEYISGYNKQYLHLPVFPHGSLQGCLHFAALFRGFNIRSGIGIIKQLLTCDGINQVSCGCLRREVSMSHCSYCVNGMVPIPSSLSLFGQNRRWGGCRTALAKSSRKSSRPPAPQRTRS